MVTRWQDRITVDPGVQGGKPIIKGTRLSVEFVILLLARGLSVRDLLTQYDHLAAEDIHACLAYAGELLKSERFDPVPAL